MTDDRRMIHVCHDGVAHVDRQAAFAYVADHRTVPEWMFGVTRFEPVGDRVRGVGARFDASMRIGPATFDSRLEIVEWEDNHRIVLSSISGFRTLSSWQFDDLGDGRMRLAVDFGYRLTCSRSASGQKLPRAACSRSIASNRALKLPLPKPSEPCRSISSKNTVGRSVIGLVKICRR